MDERRICALFARTHGLTAQHVRAAFAGAGDLPGALARLRETPDAEASSLAPPERVRARLGTTPEPLIDGDLRWLDASGAVALPCTSPLYPALLADTPFAPPALYVLGDTCALGGRAIAMVGARRATPGGCATAREIAAELARAGLVIASGLAVGIDAASHTGALDAGLRTLAVCAHGLDLLYPRGHRQLAERIRERGALVSAFPPGSAPTRPRFPLRGRMLSGLAIATLVVEAGRGSGSLHTARFALQHGRTVFAVPGSVRSPLSAGCHELLRCGAQLAEGAPDVLRTLGIHLSNQDLIESRRPRRRGAAALRPLDTDSKILLDAIGFEPVSLNTLVERTGLPSGGIASLLLILELAGHVAPQPGGRWSRVS